MRSLAPLFLFIYVLCVFQIILLSFVSKEVVVRFLVSFLFIFEQNKMLWLFLMNFQSKKTNNPL